MLDAKPVKIFVPDSNHICFIFNELLPIPVVVEVLLRYHIADKWEIYCPPLAYSAGITSHLPWGQSPNSRGFAHLFPRLVVRPARSLRLQRVRSVPLAPGSYFAVSVKTAEVATPFAVPVMVMVFGGAGRVYSWVAVPELLVTPGLA